MADPNLDFGLDYTGGITKPTAAQIGYFARVDSTGLNLEYVPLALIADVSGPVAANFGAVNLSPGVEAAGFYQVAVSLVKSAAGTAGVLSFNIGCTDADGAYVVPVATLDVVAESRKSGFAAVRSNGTAHFTISGTGITTPGAFAATYRVTLSKLA